MTTPHPHPPAQSAAAVPAPPAALRPTSQHARPGQPPRLPRLGLLCALALLLVGPAHAKRVALLMGNASYQVGRLTNPPNDVAEMEKALKALRFDVQKVLNADQNQMKRAVRDFGTAAQGADVAFVYYSGHATQASGENYLLPVKATIEKESDYAIEAIAANDVLAQIRGANPKAAILVLDACRDNPLAATTRSATKGLRPMSPPSGMLIAFATEPHNVASDNGNYARVLAAELQKPGQELLDVFRNTGAEVKRLSGGRQEPRISEVSINERLYLAGPGVQVASVTPVATGLPVQVQPDAEQEAWEIAKRRDTVASYQVYLNRYPSGRYAQTARDALEGLQPAPTPAPRPVQQAVVQAASPTPPPPAQASLQPGQAFRDCNGAHCPEMVVIPAGSFVMGSGAAEQKKAQEAGTPKELIDRESPQHSVSVRSFALGKYEVTQGQWKAVMGSNPSEFKNCGDNCPVENVSWNDIQQYLAKLNGMTGMKYRLASEAEWEYAARAGCSTAFNVGGQCRDKIEASEANFDGNYTYNGSAKGVYRQKTIEVGSFGANNWGLHNMHGNVWEWVEDVWHDNYAGAPTDGSAWKSGGDSSRRVLRGGAWISYPGNLRSAYRSRNSPDVRDYDYGFRLARTVP